MTAGSERIDADLLLSAYRLGVFPMAASADDTELFWLDPDQRGILPLDRFHVPKRLARTVRQDRYRVTADRAFNAVIDGCANRDSTWINDEIRSLYGDLFDREAAHSVEVWEEETLIGGLYGVSIGAAFFGESMFSTARDASKIALIHLAGRLIAGGYTLLDTQFITGHLTQFGAIEVPRERYKAMLSEALRSVGDFYCWPAEGVSGGVALQAVSQTS